MLVRFWLQVGPILGLKLGPFWVPKSFLSRPRRFPRHGREPESAKIDFCAIWGPTWGHFWGQVGPVLASKIAPEPPQTPPKTRSEARIRPDPQNGSKMMAPDRAANSPCQGCSAEGLERVQNGAKNNNELKLFRMPTQRAQTASSADGLEEKIRKSLRWRPQTVSHTRPASAVRAQ